MKPIKFFLYVRKSSELEERQAMSIEAQLEEVAEYARREKINIVEKFIESKSAKQPGRKEFNRMIEKIYASKEPIGVISWHPDRLARNSLDGGQIVYLIDIQKICALKFPTFWFEPTPQGLYMLQVAFGQSKYYSDNLSEKVKRGNRQKIRRGEYSGPAPVGYINNFKTRNIEPDPMKARIVEQFFKEYSTGKLNLHSAAERLNFLGIMSGNGTQYTPTMVQRMLTNVTYIGVLKRKGECYPSSFESIVDKSTFDMVQERLKDRSMPRKTKKLHDFAFRGLLSCGECGCSITAQFATGRHGGVYRYYRCSKKKGKCSQSYLLESKVADQLKGYFEKIAISDDWAEKMLTQIEQWVIEDRKDTAASSQRLELQTKAVEEKLNKLVSAYLDGDVDKEIYLTRKEDLVKTKTDLFNSKSDSGKRPNWVEPLKDWVKTIHNAGKLVDSSADLFEIKSMSEKIGTKRLLLDKKIELELVPAYALASKDRVLQLKGTKSPAKAGQLKSGKNNIHLAWRRNRDSNPRNLTVQQFSRLPQSTTLPFLQWEGKINLFFYFTTNFFKIFFIRKFTSNLHPPNNL